MHCKELRMKKKKKKNGQEIAILFYFVGEDGTIVCFEGFIYSAYMNDRI